MFLHKKEDEKAIFRRIETSDGQFLKLTDYHLVRFPFDDHRHQQAKWVHFRSTSPAARSTKCSGWSMLRTSKSDNAFTSSLERAASSCGPPKSRASPRSVGTCVLRVGTSIHDIFKVEEEGIYAPLTAAGNLVVNSVLASCHSNMAAQTLQQTFFSWWRVLSNLGGKLHDMVVEWRYSPIHLLPSRQDPFGSERAATSEDGDIPFIVEYITSAIDLFVPMTSY